MKVSIYSSFFQKIIRLFSVLVIAILLLANFRILSRLSNSRKELFSFIQNIIVIISAIFLFFNPAKIEIISIITLQYSLSMFLLDLKNPMASFMYYLGVSVLLLRGFYKKNKKSKIVFTIVIYFLFLFTQIRFGFNNFTNYFVDTLGYSIVLSLIIVFLFFYINNSIEDRRKILNLAEYKELKARDAEWLRMIQTKTKYETIAISEQVSLGTVKNRIKIIFNTLEVGDKVGFLNKYEDFEIIYEKSNDEIIVDEQNNPTVKE